MLTLRLLLIAGLLQTAAYPFQAALQAGVASIDITPSMLGPMYGYANRRCGPATGTHDNLHAKALILDGGGPRIAIVTLDLGSMSSETLFRRAANELNLPILLLSSSHTHSAPAFLPPSVPEPAPYQKEVEEKIFQALQKASSSMFPAKLGIARGSIQLGYNRLLLREDGRARAVFDNLDRIPYGPVDPEIVLLRVDDAQGQSKALLVHYAVHAVVLGLTSCLYSADYPGVMQAKVEAALPGTQVMFVQGGAGDINPLFQGRTGNSDADFATMQKMGELLAAEVIRTEKQVHPTAAHAHPTVSSTQTLKFNDRWDKEKTLELGVTTILLNRQIAIATVPGEPFHKLQTSWKHDADVPFPLFYGYTQSTPTQWPGYIPDLRSAAYGGYGADASTRIEIGAGEKIMQQHLVNLYQMKGRWLPAPGRP